MIEVCVMEANTCAKQRLPCATVHMKAAKERGVGTCMCKGTWKAGWVLNFHMHRAGKYMDQYKYKEDMGTTNGNEVS